jgi:hypothetical protein
MAAGLSYFIAFGLWQASPLGRCYHGLDSPSAYGLFEPTQKQAEMHIDIKMATRTQRPFFCVVVVLSDGQQWGVGAEWPDWGD